MRGVDPTAATVFAALLAAVAALGFWSGRWWRPAGGPRHSIEDWGLGGRRFGTVITWFLVGGDFYSAYTLIAVPAMVYAVGANGFFALVYTILVYPLVFLVMPRLWRVARKHNYVTLADFTRGRYGSRPLAAAVAVTGIVATLPYLALQLIGMQVAIVGLGFGRASAAPAWALVAAFHLLAAYDYTSGLRAPATIAVAKDFLVMAAVVAAVIWLPIHLGGYRRIFELAGRALAAHHPAGAMILPHALYLPFATLALGSAFAAFLYPHTATSILSASSDRAIERNAVLLPAYTFLLGLIALLGFLALAAGVTAANPNGIVPELFLHSFPPWFAGFGLAAIAVGALVPAAIMAISASSLVTRNLVREFWRPGMDAAQEARLAKLVSLLIKLLALGFVLWGDTSLAINLQLLGGIWILQTLPAVVLGLYRTRLHPRALLAGWAAGMAVGTAMGLALGLRSSVYPLHAFGLEWAAYAGLWALLANLLVAAALTPAFRGAVAADETSPADYEPAIADSAVAG